MKKVLFVFLGLLLVIIVAAFVIPVLFKDDIKEAIDKEIAKSVDADVVFDADNFGLSIFSNFPNITAELKDFGVINRAPFEGTILFAAHFLEVEVNLGSVLFGDHPRIKGISVDGLEANIKVLKDGRANYDIYIAAEETTEVPEEKTEGSGDFAFGIDHWQIENAHITYADASLPFHSEVKGLSHSGSGDFTQDIIDLETLTEVDSLSVDFDGINYLSKEEVAIDMALKISDNYEKYTFDENTVRVNDFAFGFEGFFGLKEESMPMDIVFHGKETDFKSILSLVPGVFTKDFEGIKTEGTLSFDGFAKGEYSEARLPAFRFALLVGGAMFQYPDLPTAVKNIDIDMAVDNKSGIIEETEIDVKQFHMDFGTNPIDIVAHIKNLKNYDMKAQVAAKLNLADLSSMFPMEGLTMKGLYDLNLKAEGIYDEKSNTFPKVDAAMSLKQGYVKSAEFPLPMENVQFFSTIKNGSGKMVDTQIDVHDFVMLMDGEEFDADLVLRDLDDYTWDLNAKGAVDLEKILHVFPLEGMELSGKIKADISTKGKMSDLDAERYERLPTSGTMSVDGFNYKDQELPYDVIISTASASFNPKSMELEQMKGKIGKSDIAGSGSITNYIGYLFGEQQTLKGKVNFNAKYMDLNEFMVEEEGEAAEVAVENTGDSLEMGVIPVPENIDFVLNASIRTLKMMEWTLDNITGRVIAKNGVATMDNIKFNMLGGSFLVNGDYNAHDIQHPKYNFKLNIDELPISKSYQAFTTVQTFAPIAKYFKGNVSTDFDMSGELDGNMMPDMNTISGSGLFKIAKAALTSSKQVKLLSSISSKTKMKNNTLLNIKDAAMSAKIEDGTLKTDPFEVEYGGYKGTVSGSSRLDGGIQYQWDMDLPAGRLGTNFNQLVGGNKSADELVPIKINIGGTFLSPKIGLDLSEAKNEVKTALKDEVKKQTGNLVKDLVKGKKSDEMVGNLLGNKNKKDSGNTTSVTEDAKKAKEELKKKLETESLKKVKGLFKKKGNNR